MHGRPVFGWASIVLMLSFLPLFGFVFLFFVMHFLHEARTFTPAQASQLGGLLLVAWLAQAGFDPALSLLYMYLISSLSYPSCPFPFFFPPKIPNSHDDISSLLLFFILMAVIVAKSA